MPFPVLVRRRGAVFLLDPRNWIDTRVVAGAPFEHRQIAAAQKLIETKSIDLFIDIGANFGLYSVLLGRMDEIKQVVAFEPVRRNYAQLLGNIFANSLTAKATVHRVALSRASGQATIHIDPTSTGVSRLDVSTSHRDTGVFAEHETVELARFDDVFASERRSAFVKVDVDVEGEALAVLEGMQRFLATNDVVLQVELSASEDNGVRAFLGGLGFAEIARVEADVVFARK